MIHLNSLQHALVLANNHANALQDALDELNQQPPTEQELENLTKARRRLLDQFAYRYTRLQDDMGNKLFPACLRMLGEDIEQMPATDRFNRLEPRIRNEFSRDIPKHLKSNMPGSAW